MPFNSQNPYSVVIMDNCAIHHVEEMASVIEDVGSLVHYPLPYSPNLNPIESAFSKVKLELQQSELENHGIAVTDVETLLLQTFTSITPENCKNRIHETKLVFTSNHNA